jgi:hypothetical protein
MYHNPVNKCVLVYYDGTELNITDEFNETLKDWNYSFYQLSESIKHSMGADRIRFC